MPVVWGGSEAPEKCDFCSTPIDSEEHFIDGKTKYGSWAIMCESCHKRFGNGLGTGRGQKFNTKTLIKVEG